MRTSIRSCYAGSRLTSRGFALSARGISLKVLFSRFLEFDPTDHLAKMYLERALQYEQQPSDESWTAAEVFTKK